MNRKLFFILFALSSMNISAQEYIQVNTLYDRGYLMIEIINNSDGEMIIPHSKPGGELVSFWDIYFLDENGERINTAYPPPSQGIPFNNAPEIPQPFLLIAPNSSLVFRYSYNSFIHYCKEPDRIKQIKINYYIKYHLWKNNCCVNSGVYKDFSQTIPLSWQQIVFIHDTIKNVIKNKKNYIGGIIKQGKNCYYSATEQTSYPLEIYKAVFSMDKIEKLALENQGFALILYCDSTGKTLEVDFLLRHMSIPDKITMDEIEALESAFKDHRIDFNQYCPNVTYFQFVVRCNFREILKKLHKDES